MRLTHRPVAQQDLAAICAFTQSAAELFYCFPKADFPLTPRQLQAAIEQRSDSTVVLLEGAVVAFANFYRWESGGGLRHRQRHGGAGRPRTCGGALFDRADAGCSFYSPPGLRGAGVLL